MLQCVCVLGAYRATNRSTQVLQFIPCASRRCVQPAGLVVWSWHAIVIEPIEPVFPFPTPCPRNTGKGCWSPLIFSAARTTTYYATGARAQGRRRGGVLIGESFGHDFAAARCCLPLVTIHTYLLSKPQRSSQARPTARSLDCDCFKLVSRTVCA